MKNVIKHIKSNFNSTMDIQLCVLSVILIVCNYCIYRSSDILSNLVRTCSIGLILLGIVVNGKKTLVYTMFIHALAIMYFNNYNNYTSFIILIICCIHSRKLLKPYLIVYVLGVLVCMVLNKDNFERAIIHIVWCVVFYLEFDRSVVLVDAMKKRNQELEEENERLKNLLSDAEKLVTQRRKLELTNDEIEIIEKLVQGYEIKEVENFSEATVYVKLKNARVRNGFLNNAELLNAFKKEKITLE